MAHHRRGAKSAGHAGHAHIRLRQHRGRRNPNLPRRQVGHRGSRQPRPPDQSHPGHRLRLRRGARRRQPRSWAPCEPPRGPKTAALHQLRRPVHPDLGEVGERRLRHRQHRLARGRRTPPSRSSASRRCSIWSTATCATPTWPPTGCAPGRTGSRTTPARRATGRGCRRRATTRTNWATGQSVTAPTRPTSRCPSPGPARKLRGLWYSFTAGSVRVVSLNNDDVAFQDGGNFYVHGYSAGEQKRWLAAELADARRDPNVDWLVVCMHQTAISTADKANGADLGIRQEWLPLFDQYQVDLVVCGHEHHYERSHPVRGTLGTDTRTPIPVDTRNDLIDTTRGTVHLVIGGGGTSFPTNGLFFPQPRCRVITGVGAFDPALGRKEPIYVLEDAPWSAFPRPRQPVRLRRFRRRPGPAGRQHRRSRQRITRVTGPFGAMSTVEQFTLTKPRGGEARLAGRWQKPRARRVGEKHAGGSKQRLLNGLRFDGRHRGACGNGRWSPASRCSAISGAARSAQHRRGSPAADRRRAGTARGSRRRVRDAIGPART